MFKAKEVKSTDGGDGLDSLSLSSLEGVVIFSETKDDKLNLIVDKEHGLKLKWCNYPSTAFIKVGDRIRGFYRNIEHYKDEKVAYLNAYELLDDEENVLTRSCKPDYAFVEAYDF